MAEAVFDGPQIFARPALPAQFELTPPKSLGVLTDSFSAGEDRPLVVLIQDLHAHYGVQKNIAKLLEFLSSAVTPADRKQGSSVVSIAVEGASGPLDHSLMALFPDAAIREKAADYLVREGELTGADYYAITHALPHALTGVEEANYYELNRALYRKTFRDREELVGVLKTLQSEISLLRPRRASPALRELDQQWAAIEKGTLSPEAFLATAPVSGPDLEKDFPALAHYRTLAIQLPPERLRVLTQSFLENVQGQLSGNERQTLVQLARQAGGAPYFFYLRDVIHRHRLFMAVPLDLAKYIEWMSVLRGMGMDGVMHELRELVFRLKLEKAREGLERDRLQVEHDLALLVRMTDLQVTQNELQTIGKRLDGFVALASRLLSLSSSSSPRIVSGDPVSLANARLKELISSSIDYYALAHMRNEPMVKNTLKLCTGHGSQSTVVLIAGGFHTTPITKLLRERGVSYAVITPRVDFISEADRTLYIKRLSGELLSEEEVLANAGKSMRQRGWERALSKSRSLLKRQGDTLAVGAVLTAGAGLMALLGVWASAHGLPADLSSLSNMIHAHPDWAQLDPVTAALVVIPLMKSPSVLRKAPGDAPLKERGSVRLPGLLARLINMFKRKVPVTVTRNAGTNTHDKSNRGPDTGERMSRRQMLVVAGGGVVSAMTVKGQEKPKVQPKVVLVRQALLALADRLQRMPDEKNENHANIARWVRVFANGRLNLIPSDAPVPWVTTIDRRSDGSFMPMHDAADGSRPASSWPVTLFITSAGAEFLLQLASLPAGQQYRADLLAWLFLHREINKRSAIVRFGDKDPNNLGHMAKQLRTWIEQEIARRSSGQYESELTDMGYLGQLVQYYLTVYARQETAGLGLLAEAMQSGVLGYSALNGATITRLATYFPLKPQLMIQKFWNFFMDVPVEVTILISTLKVSDGHEVTQKSEPSFQAGPIPQSVFQYVVDLYADPNLPSLFGEELKFRQLICRLANTIELDPKNPRMSGSYGGRKSDFMGYLSKIDDDELTEGQLQKRFAPGASGKPPRAGKPWTEKEEDVAALLPRAAKLAMVLLAIISPVTVSKIDSNASVVPEQNSEMRSSLGQTPQKPLAGKTFYGDVLRWCFNLYVNIYPLFLSMSGVPLPGPSTHGALENRSSPSFEKASWGMRQRLRGLGLLQQFPSIHRWIFTTFPELRSDQFFDPTQDRCGLSVNIGQEYYPVITRTSLSVPQLLLRLERLYGVEVPANRIFDINEPGIGVTKHVAFTPGSAVGIRAGDSGVLVSTSRVQKAQAAWPMSTRDHWRSGWVALRHRAVRFAFKTWNVAWATVRRPKLSLGHYLETVGAIQHTMERAIRAGDLAAEKAVIDIRVVGETAGTFGQNPAFVARVKKVEFDERGKITRVEADINPHHTRQVLELALIHELLHIHYRYLQKNGLMEEIGSRDEETWVTLGAIQFYQERLNVLNNAVQEGALGLRQTFATSATPISSTPSTAAAFLMNQLPAFTDRERVRNALEQNRLRAVLGAA